MMPSTVFLERVVLKDYRSIANCDIRLGELTFLLGPNGSGKSNFFDALRLVTDGLNTSLDHALRERGGMQEVGRRSNGHPRHFGIRLHFRIGDQSGLFAFEVGARPRGEFVIKEERCSLGDASYVVREGKVVQPTGSYFPPAFEDRLYLTNAAGLPQFRPVFDALSRMGFYNVSPDRVRELQPPDKGDILKRDGSNLASVVARLSRPESAGTLLRIEEYLRRVVPGLTGFATQRVGHMETLEFRQEVEGAANAWRFPAITMSDGTLRALAILVALFQSADQASGIPLVGLEEPETALHPAAAGVLRDCIREAAGHVQVLVTSHSADLLDDPDLPVDSLLAVQAEGGRTRIGPLDDTVRDALRRHLYTAGELLRADQLSPAPTPREANPQADLFDGLPEP